MKNKVFVTDTHTRMALAVIRELGQAGYEVVSVSRKGLRPLGHASRYAKQSVTLPEDGYADALLSLANHSRSVLLPTGMFTLNEAAKRYGEFTSAFRMLLSGAAELQNAGDKPTVAETARALGLSVPQVFSLDSPVFPCVIKYRNGEALQLSAEARYAIIENEARYLSTLKAMQQNGEIFVSQYIQGKGRGVSAVLDGSSEPLAVFCHERVREYPIQGGPACCAVSVWDGGLIENALKLFKALGLKGFAMAEFKGKHLLEVNPRIWGTYPLSRLCGAGMAEAYVRGALGTKAEQKTYIIGMRMQYGVNDAAHFASGMRQGRCAFGVLKDALDPRVRGGVFDMRDLPGSWAYVKGLLTL
jgi:predicted ATP-grasp superfamily ATP-dependent carboligase